MTETPEPEPDVPTQLKDLGKKYLRFWSKLLDSAAKSMEGYPNEDIEPTAPARRARKPRAKKPVAKPIQNVGFLGWLKGPDVEERKDSR